MSRAKRSPFDFRGVVRITRLGLGFLGFTFVIGFAALNTGNNSLYVILACMLGALITSGLVSRRALHTIGVEVRASREIWAGRPALSVLKVNNQSRWLPLRDLVVVMPEMEHPVMISEVGRGAVEEVEVNLLFERRGRVSMRHVDLYSRYPFGLFTKKRRVRVEADAVVYPAVRKEDVWKGRQLEGGDIRPLNKPGHGLEVFGFREYRDGESVRAVHWKRSVSTGRLIVRQGTTETNDEVAIALDTYLPGNADPLSFEPYVSGAATAVLEAHRQGRVVTLYLPGSRISSQKGVQRLFEALALVPATSNPGPVSAPAGALLFSMRTSEGGQRETA